MYVPPSNSRSPLRYPGGKSEMVRMVMWLLGGVTNYIEPFAGGASVALSMRRQCPWSHVWINDHDPCITDFFTILSGYPIELHRRVQRLWQQFATFEDAIQFFEGILPVLRTDQLDPMQRASAFFICNRLGYSGMTVECGTTGAGSRRINDRVIDALPYWGKVAEGMHITALDYRHVLTRADNDASFYFDSPYEHGAGTNRAIYWGKPWGQSDFDELAEQMACLDRRGVRWVTTLMLSQPTEMLFIDKLRTRSANRISVKRLSVQHSLVHRPAEELLIWNFKV